MQASRAAVSKSNDNGNERLETRMAAAEQKDHGLEPDLNTGQAAQVCKPAAIPSQIADDSAKPGDHAVNGIDTAVQISQQMGREGQPVSAEMPKVDVSGIEAAKAVSPPSQPGNSASEEPAVASKPLSNDHKLPAERPLVPQLSMDAALERIEGLLTRLSLEHDTEGFFKEKVSTEMPGCENYYERIKKPMWLSKIKDKVRNQPPLLFFLASV